MKDSSCYIGLKRSFLIRADHSRRVKRRTVLGFARQRHHPTAKVTADIVFVAAQYDLPQLGLGPLLGHLIA